MDRRPKKASSSKRDDELLERRERIERWHGANETHTLLYIEKEKGKQGTLVYLSNAKFFKVTYKF